MSKRNSKKQQKITLETFKQIFIDHWEEFTSTHSRYNTQYYNEIIEKMINCGNPDEMGYAGWRCMCCGEYHKVAMAGK
jgi:methionyl-tRNA synthetase